MPWDAMDGDMDEIYYGREGPAGHVSGKNKSEDFYDDGYPTAAYMNRHAHQMPMYTFYTLKELVSSDVFQEQLGKALAFKQKQIDDLRNEILAILETEAI